MKNGKLFQKLLAEDQEFLKQFESVYHEVSNNLQSNQQEIKLFTIRYQVYDVVTNIWVNKVYLLVEDMKEAISSLQANSLELEDEIVHQEQILQTSTSSMSLN